MDSASATARLLLGLDSSSSESFVFAPDLVPPPAAQPRPPSFRLSSPPEALPSPPAALVPAAIAPTAVPRDSLPIPDSLVRRISGPSDQKAGLTRDPEEVRRIIYEASRNSPYFRNQQAKDTALTLKVDALLLSLDQQVNNRNGDLAEEEAEVDRILADLDKERDCRRVIAVFDADAFYASCEELVDPSLKGKAFAVGEGVLTTASYEARKFGCRSAQPGFIAKLLCPHLLFVTPKFKLYTECSAKIFAVLGLYGPMSPASLDEAYCDITDFCRREKLTPAEAVARIRLHVKTDTGLSISAGVSSNATISKIAADLNKPDGQFVVEPGRESEMAFMSTLRIRQVPGIGRVSERWLHALEITHVSQIYTHRSKLYLIRTQIGLTSLLRRYLGLGTSLITSPNRLERKSCGTEETFSRIFAREEIMNKLKEVAINLEGDLRRTGFKGRTVSLVFKLDTFESFTRAKSLGKGVFIDDAPSLFKIGKALFEKVVQERHAAFDAGKKVEGCNGGKELWIRLLGLRVTNLVDTRAPAGGSDKTGKKGLEGWVTSKGKRKALAPPDKDEDEVEFESLSQRHFSHNPESDMALLDQEEEVVPGSSAELWDQMEELPLDQGEDTAMEGEEGEEEFRYKTFYTAGPSIDSRKEPKRAALAAKKDRITFALNAPEPPVPLPVIPPTVKVDEPISKSSAGVGAASGSTWTGNGGLVAKGKGKGQEVMRELECPICEIVFQSSEVGMSGHVEACLARLEETSNKSKKSVVKKQKMLVKKAVVAKESVKARETVKDKEKSKGKVVEKGKKGGGSESRKGKLDSFFSKA